MIGCSMASNHIGVLEDMTGYNNVHRQNKIACQPLKMEAWEDRSSSMCLADRSEKSNEG